MITNKSFNYKNYTWRLKKLDIYGDLQIDFDFKLNASINISLINNTNTNVSVIPALKRELNQDF